MSQNHISWNSGTLVLATHNPGKLSEIRDFLTSGAAPAWQGLITSAGELDLEGAEETGTTYAENALLKARSLRDRTGFWTLADDAGLSVDALGGEPGVQTAHYGGFTRLLHEMFHVNPCDRTATFHCVLALAAPDSREWLFEGHCKGSITTEARGTGGFGYDPVFVPASETRTFAEMSQSEKGAQSHRGMALRHLLTWLVNYSKAEIDAERIK